jgi:hypothetical protein
MKSLLARSHHPGRISARSQILGNLKFLYHNWLDEANTIGLVLWVREVNGKGKAAFFPGNSA